MNIVRSRCPVTAYSCGRRLHSVIDGIFVVVVVVGGGSCWTSQQHAMCVSGTNLLSSMCCHTEMKSADKCSVSPTYTRPTSPNTDPRTPGAWQCKPLGVRLINSFLTITGTFSVMTGTLYRVFCSPEYHFRLLKKRGKKKVYIP